MGSKIFFMFALLFIWKFMWRFLLNCHISIIITESYAFYLIEVDVKWELIVKNWSEYIQRIFVYIQLGALWQKNSVAWVHFQKKFQVIEVSSTFFEIPFKKALFEINGKDWNTPRVPDTQIFLKAGFSVEVNFWK